METDLAQDLLEYIDAAPTPWHAVGESVRRLEAAGYRALDDHQTWRLGAGDKVYVTRAGTSLIACQVGQQPLERSGFRVVGAHTDSPNLRLKPNPVFTKAGVAQLGVEVYGGVLWHTWLDRDLSLAGRVVVAGPDGQPVSHLLDFGRTPLLRVSSLAIHLNRQVNTDGLKLNPQQHLAPMWALESSGPVDLKALIAARLEAAGTAVAPSDVLAWDLCLYDVQPGARSGLSGEFLHAPRLDNLASSHAGLCALLGAQTPASTCAVVLYDHEEVGSRSAQGAGSPFLKDTLERVATAVGAGSREAYLRALGASFVISADMAHAHHPNWADQHEPQHAPLLGKGPVIKTNVNQSYATDSETAAFFITLCRQADVPFQHFVTRTDLPCGSTIGPITAGQLGVRTLDVGNPMLSMHSIRELCAASDVEKMISVLRRFFT
jgi:aspartyl aminopeptidase